MSIVRASALLVLAVLLAACGSPAADDLQDTATTTTAAEGVLHDGDRVTAGGRVVQVPNGPVRLCAPEAREDIGYASGFEPPPALCEQGVDLEGADLSTLTDRREKAGAVEGWADVVGVLRGNTVRVEQQSSYRREGQPDEASDEVPCPAPPGGWPRDPSILRGPGHEPEGDANMDRERPALEAYRSAHPAALVDVAFLRPFPDSVLLGISTPDERTRAAAEAALRPAYGARLCVVVSRHSAAELQAVDQEVTELWRDPERHGLLSSGTTVRDDLQRSVVLSVVRMTDELLAAVDRHPPGLLRVEPWLVRASER